jgi:hypothetical protein
MEILVRTLKEQGYDIERPEQLNLRPPRTLEEVQPFVDSLKEVEHEDDTDVRVLISILICKCNAGIIVGV